MYLSFPVFLSQYAKYTEFMPDILVLKTLISVSIDEEKWISPPSVI